MKSLNYTKRIWRIKKNIYNYFNINKKKIKLQKKFRKMNKGIILSFRGLIQGLTNLGLVIPPFTRDKIRPYIRYKQSMD